jgi:HSP20 family protein
VHVNKEKVRTMTTLMRRHVLPVERPELFGRLFGENMWPEGLFGSVFSNDGLLKVEEFTEDGKLVIRTELPGIDPDKDVEIALHDGMLTITGQRREEERTESRSGYRTEFRYGRFERTLALPAGTVEADIEAAYHDGILEVRVPAKGRVSETTKIPVARS